MVVGPDHPSECMIRFRRFHASTRPAAPTSEINSAVDTRRSPLTITPVTPARTLGQSAKGMGVFMGKFLDRLRRIIPARNSSNTD
jgi:hypothetical protein